jgi:hypothetical protein
MTKPLSNGATREIDTEIDLKDPRLAAFLAWLVPGMGHFYQGRTGKGVLFFVCILGTFAYGLYIGKGRVVYASTEPILSRKFFTERWQYPLGQVWLGLPALPALVQRHRVNNGQAPLFGPSLENKFMRPPYTMATIPEGETGFYSKDPSDERHRISHPDELAKWHYERGEYFEIGTYFTVIAGLLNILAIFDAYGGPLVIPAAEEKKKPDDKSPSKGEET